MATAASEGRPSADRFAGLHVLCDDDPRWKLDVVEQARAACAGGAAVVQLRAKHATDRQALTWARALRALCRAEGVAFVVNDRFDLALASEADGVHLGQTDLPPRALSEAVRARLAVGRSTHSLEQALATRDEPVDYVAFGPVFRTRSKESEYDARGLAALAEVVAAVAPRPVVAIGGIGEAQIEGVIAHGAAGVAVISAVIGADDPRAAARRLAAAFAPGGCMDG